MIDTCGCFPKAPARVVPYNRPGLDQLAYRSGTHPQVLARLLWALDARSRGGPLGRLTTREPDDPTIALLDAFATVADVLTFYGERIVNEGYLRTASERRSLLELARLIGYELAPGVAASTWLAFGVEERGETDPASAAPPQALVPRGTKVLSLPADGGLPQTFETSEDLTARAERNVLRAQLTAPAVLDPAAASVYVAGVASGVRAGDMMVLAAGADGGPIAGAPAARRAVRVTVEAEQDRTRIDFEALPAPSGAAASVASQASAAGGGASVAGGGASAGGGVSVAGGGASAARPAGASGSAIGVEPAGGPRPVATGPSRLGIGTSAMVKSDVDAFFASDWTEEAQATFLAVSGWSAGAIWAHQSAPVPPAAAAPGAAPGLYVLRDRRAPFGHNAPRVKKALTDEQWTDWDAGGGLPVTTSDSQAATSYPAGIDLDSPAPRIVAGSWVALERPGAAPLVCRVSATHERSRADFAMSAKVAHVDLAGAGGAAATGLASFKIRETTVHVESERLELAPAKLAEAVPAGTTELMLDAIAPGMAAGKPVAFAGEDAALAGVRWTEVVRLTTVSHLGGHTRLGFEPLVHGYLRSTIEVSANVVAATHGETTADQPIGSGNGQADQRFELPERPLTYVPASAGSGAASTLEVRVDGVRWHEARGLYGLGPRDERYVVRRDDGGGTQIVFGDGVRGTRPPSGEENVVASYRRGIGADGMVAGGALTLLQTRPPGVRDVINPGPAFGAEDPESPRAARANAPLTVLTLDRVVSLGDYEDFAAAFAGIGKARATALWHGERRIVHVTVAAPHGQDAAPETRAALTAALRAAGDPSVDVRVGGFRRVAFALAVSVLLDGRREAAAAIGEARAELAARFGFERRAFGQGVSQAEVVATVLGVDGIVDVRVSTLRPVPLPGAAAGPDTQDPLLARLAGWSATAPGEIEPAALLFLSPAGATVTERSA